MGKRLSLGLVEDKEYQWPNSPKTVFDDNGPYQSALSILDTFLEKQRTENIHELYWDRALKSGSTLPAANYEEARIRHRRTIRWLMVKEAEEGRIWSHNPPDYMSVLREYHKRADRDAAKLKDIIGNLRDMDAEHAYLLRHALQHALQEFMSPEKIKKQRIPNMNLEKGYKLVTVSGPVVRGREFQFLSKLSFFHFDEMLDEWEKEIDKFFRPWPGAWKEFGALRFEQEISKRSAAKMNIAQLGLMAKLTSRIRDFTAGHGVWTYSTGQPIPTHGKPCWSIVAEFINC